MRLGAFRRQVPEPVGGPSPDQGRSTHPGRAADGRPRPVSARLAGQAPPRGSVAGGACSENSEGNEILSPLQDPPTCTRAPFLKKEG